MNEFFLFCGFIVNVDFLDSFFVMLPFFSSFHFVGYTLFSNDDAPLLICQLYLFLDEKFPPHIKSVYYRIFKLHLCSSLYSGFFFLLSDESLLWFICFFFAGIGCIEL